MPAEQWTKIATTTRRSLPALLFACGILGLLGFEALRSYRAVQRDAERNVENLVQVLSAQTERTIEAVDQNLQDVATQVANAPNLRDDDALFRGDCPRFCVPGP